MSKYKDITNQKFGMLTAIKFIEIKNGSTKWLFRCDCGKEKIITSGNVCGGTTVSCGCYTIAQTIARSIKHGMFKKPIYNAWDSMIQRCTNRKHKSYKDYGGRGINICDRWREFENFYKDMGEKPSPKHSIERRDVNGNYNPENCYWATIEQQGYNKRNTVRITFNGQTKNIIEWSKETGLTLYTIRNRLYTGWSPEKILTTPKLR